MHSVSYTGKKKRLDKIFRNGKTLIVPVDDSLMFGPFVALENMSTTVASIIRGKPSAILGFKGTYSKYDINVPFIFNITGSTTRGNHVQKLLISSPMEALILGADCVAVHINYTSKYENEMIRMLATTISEADSIGMPVLTIAYPRRQNADNTDYNYEDLKAKDNEAYTELVSHVVRTSAELGADIIKTQYTGDSESFKKVVESAMGTPVVIAGGPLVPVEESYLMAKGALDAGASGISFGRNVFNADDIEAYLAGLSALIFDNASVKAALTIYSEKTINAK